MRPGRRSIATLAPILERLWETPDSSTISTMLQHAEGSFDERVAMILPTLKVILLGGMQEPGHAAGTTVAGLLESGQAAAVAADPAGLVRDAIEEGLRWVSPIGTQTRRVRVETELGGVTLPVGREPRSARLVGQSRRGGLGADRRLPTTCFGPGATTAAFGFGPHFCSGHHFSRVQMRIAVQRLFERLPSLRSDPDRPPSFNGWEFRAPAAPPRPTGTR